MLHVVREGRLQVYNMEFYSFPGNNTGRLCFDAGSWTLKSSNFHDGYGLPFSVKF